jgi:outer membrane protein OmpA-like peptidoglycan-associated protein
MMTLASRADAQFSSSLWLPLLLLAGGLFLAGCGATAPVVQSVSGPDTLETEETGTFEASINDQEADEPLTYNWSFGDGSTASGLLTNHSYSSTGRYSIRFQASNEGGSDSDTISVQVVPQPQPAQITSINASPNPVDEGEPVRFSSNVQGDSPLSRDWSFGDGSTSMSQSPTHTYEEPGEYTARLEASNDVGTDTRTVTVRVNRVLPEVCTTVSELNSSFFESNSSTLTGEAQKSLQENADILSKCPNLSVRVEGYAAPGERNEQALSEDRAEAVANFYENNGVSSDRIETSGQGQVEGVTTKKGGTRQYRRVDSIPEEMEGDM